MDKNELYRKFLRELREQKNLEDVLSLLAWDERVLMKEAGSTDRAAQEGTLSTILHERKTRKEYFELVEELAERNDLTEDEAVNVRETRRELRRLSKVSSALARALTEKASETHSAWIRARKEKSFAIVERSLQQLVELKIEYAECVRETDNRYDALLDLYEHGITSEEVAVLFSEVGPKLRTLATKVESAAEVPAISLSREIQQKIISTVVTGLGFDFAEGRLDETVHPFCSEMGPHDIRITTRYKESSLFPALFAAIHETGHALYDHGTPKDLYGTPLGTACSLGVHESQSLLWERHVGHSREFCSYLIPILKKHEPKANLSADDLYRKVNQVRRSFIRVEADEVTYGLHIILRFELERKLIGGELRVNELRDAWNEQYEKHLAIRPADDLLGVLQDTHWYGGMFGYFPTYLLGAIYAAQIFAAFAAENSTTKADIEEGRFFPLRDFLTRNIYRHGQRYEGKKLVALATKKPVTAEAFLSHLQEQYRER